MTSVTAPATPKIVGKALYLELVPDLTIDEDELRSLVGWQKSGVRQIIVFPEYQDDTGKVYGAVVMDRIISSMTPRSQWDFTYTDRYRIGEANPDSDNTYVDYPNYGRDEWDSLSEREKAESRARVLKLTLQNYLVGTCYATNPVTGGRDVVAKQGWVVRESKPIAVEITDQDMTDIHHDQKTPQAVIRRINKVRESLDKFPAKLA